MRTTSRSPGPATRTPSRREVLLRCGRSYISILLYINIITFSYILLACVISKILLSFFGEMWTKKSINLSFINYFVAEEFDSVILVPLTIVLFIYVSVFVARRV